MKPEKNDATVLLRLPAELKAALTREALANGRRITAEINTRLANSLREPPGRLQGPVHHYPGAARSKVVHLAQDGAGQELTDLERAMLAVFSRLEPEKQLALLSLFK